jgi:putative spermidine/putrescine transport system substrate-binding protein
LTGRLLAVALLALAACEPGPNSANTVTSPSPPTAGIRPQASIGPGEGVLDLITWDGYTEDAWVKLFTQETGCQVRPYYASSTAQMVQMMQGGGGGQWDMVSAPGDISLDLIYTGEVKPMNPTLIPDWTYFQPLFQSPAYNTVGGVHYGISLQWSQNTLLYNSKKLTPAPATWSVLYDSSHKGAITVPDNPMQIADAALYLEKTQPELGIKDPYALDKRQFDDAMSLLQLQRPLIKRYWSIASDEISMFQDGSVVAGAGGPYQALALQSIGIPVAETLPSEGATAWGDSWMLAADAPHPNCAYRWAAYASAAQVQAQQAIYFGETPVNPKACSAMNALLDGSCAKYHADASASYMASISFWKTPRADCGSARSCVPYSDWVAAWTALKNQ